MNSMRLLNPQLWDILQPYKATEAQMPWAYQAANPDGRPTHDDWAIGKSVKRIDCAYRVPLPFRVISGPSHKEWILWDYYYPLSPGHAIELREYATDHGVFMLPHVEVDAGDYGLVTYASFIGDEWRPVFTKYTGKWFGKRLSWYKGLHQDLHVSPPDANGVTRSDLMAWFPEFACSWVAES